MVREGAIKSFPLFGTYILFLISTIHDFHPCSCQLIFSKISVTAMSKMTQNVGCLLPKDIANCSQNSVIKPAEPTVNSIR